MAKKDTSGKEGANVNHWCVASDTTRYYRDERYKGGNRGGIFIIIVKKKEDGSPDWNKRYLYWNKGPEDKETEKKKQQAPKKPNPSLAPVKAPVLDRAVVEDIKVHEDVI